MDDKKRGCSGCAIVSGLFLLGCAIIIGAFVNGLFGLFRDRLNEDGGPLASLTSAPVVVVPVEGVILESRPLVKLLSKIGETSSVKAVVLRIDSPGGSVGSSEEIYRAALSLRNKGKVVVASMGNSGASGGYYIACGANEIITNEGTVTGSIGVIADSVVIEKLLLKLGVDSQVTKSGLLKETGTPMRKPTYLESALLENVILDMYRQFFTVVLKSRGEKIDKAFEKNADFVEKIISLNVSETSSTKKAFEHGEIAKQLGCSLSSEERLSRIADGRILTGRQAVVVGLADQIGGLNDAISRAGVLANLGDNPKYTEKKPVSKLNDWLSSEAGTALDRIIYSRSNSLKMLLPTTRME